MINCLILIEKKHIEKIVTDFLQDGEIFLVSAMVKPGNKIMVFIDGDNGVSIDDCVKLSRHLESQFDREKEDFELNVSSAGADQPLKMSRQYGKHKGRTLKIKLLDEQMLNGTLEEVKEEGIVIRIPANKKKKIEDQVMEINFDQIDFSKVEITFKK